MSLTHTLTKLSKFRRSLPRTPREVSRERADATNRRRGEDFARTLKATPSQGVFDSHSENPLRAYFEANRQGPGVWKWLHYFDIYERHLRKFVGRDVNLVEVGVYSGGSLPMWHQYFGERCHVHGVDIQAECRAYGNERTTIHIGDQGDRAFWSYFRKEVPSVDVFIDDGGHIPEQQMVTLEEMLPHLRPGGVYICEDVHGSGNDSGPKVRRGRLGGLFTWDDNFGAFVQGMTSQLNAFDAAPREDGCDVVATAFQAAVYSVHLYPYVVVVEKHAHPPSRLSSEKHGTQWQPFLKVDSAR
jgi:hypothetical protein